MEAFTLQEEKNIRTLFRWSVSIKGLISFAEVVVGTLLFFVPISDVTNLFMKLMHNEVAEDGTDFITIHLASMAHDLAIAGSVFIAVYLLSRGLIKLLLIIALLKDKIWAYPWSLVVLGLFVVYQMYQIWSSFSGVIVALTIFDLIVMWSIWEEYKVLKAHKLAKEAARMS